MLAHHLMHACDALGEGRACDERRKIRNSAKASMWAQICLRCTHRRACILFVTHIHACKYACIAANGMHVVHWRHVRTSVRIFVCVHAVHQVLHACNTSYSCGLTRAFVWLITCITCTHASNASRHARIAACMSAHMHACNACKAKCLHTCMHAKHVGQDILGIATFGQGRSRVSGESGAPHACARCSSGNTHRAHCEDAVAP